MSGWTAELNFDHKQGKKQEHVIDSVERAWRSIRFDRYIKQTYEEKNRSIRNGTYNPNRALKAA